MTNEVLISEVFKQKCDEVLTQLNTPSGNWTVSITPQTLTAIFTSGQKQVSIAPTAGYSKVACQVVGGGNPVYLDRTVTPAGVAASIKAGV